MCPMSDSAVNVSDQSVFCDFCRSRYHIPCSDIAETLLKALTANSNNWNFWCCFSYRSSDLPRRPLQERQEKLEAKLWMEQQLLYRKLLMKK